MRPLGGLEPKNPYGSSVNRGDAAIHVLPGANAQVNSTENRNGYIRCVLDDTAVYSCYYSPNAPLQKFQAYLDDLEGSVRQWPGSIIAGDFNAKSRSWSGSPKDKGEQLLDKIIASLNLIVINQPGMATFERRPSSSVLDLTYLRPSLRKHLCEWRVLEKVSLSNKKSHHRYVWIELQQTWRMGCQEIWRGHLCRMHLEHTRTGQDQGDGWHDATLDNWQYKNQRLAFWWYTEISELRNCCIKQRRKALIARKRRRSEKQEENDRYKAFSR